MKPIYHHLSKKEREIIAALFQDGLKQNKIAKTLERDPGTISREINRNKTMIGILNNNNPKAKKKAKNFYYFPDNAQKKYEKRRKESKQKLGLKTLVLREYVLQKLKEGVSPRLISGRAKILKIGSISHEAIYQFIYRKENLHLKLWKNLLRAHKRRRPKLARKAKRYLIPNRIDIGTRSEKVNTREAFGHWEADSIVGSRGTSHVLHTEIERKTRLVRIRKITRKTAKNTTRAMKRMFRSFPPEARQSTTADNGPEFCDWEAFAKALSMEVFFATPYHSWERGSNERANGLIRRFFPKKTDFTKISHKQIQKVEDWINNRPMECLDFLTPNEAFALQLSRFSLNCT
jgi:IS30 family transposase